MDNKIKPIRNKYDVYSVDFTFNEFFTKLIEKDFSATKSTKNETIMLILRAVLSAFILLSYFHKTPFPNDKPLILLCMVVYAVMNLYFKYFDKTVAGGFHTEFVIDRANFPARLKDSKVASKDGKVLLKLGSEVKLLSSNYTLVMDVNNKSTSTTIKYEDYIDFKGNLNESKLEQFFYDNIGKVASSK